MSLECFYSSPFNRNPLCDISNRLFSFLHMNIQLEIEYLSISLSFVNDWWLLCHVYPTNKITYHKTNEEEGCLQVIFGIGLAFLRYTKLVFYCCWLWQCFRYLRISANLNILTLFLGIVNGITFYKKTSMIFMSMVNVKWNGV